MYVCEIIIELIHFNIIRGNITIYYVLEEDVGEKKTLWAKNMAIAVSTNGTSDEKDWKE